MKRNAPLTGIKEAGCVLVRHGAKHDWCRNLGTGVCYPLPRHRKIKDRLAKHILAKLDCR